MRTLIFFYKTRHSYPILCKKKELKCIGIGCNIHAGILEEPAYSHKHQHLVSLDDKGIFSVFLILILISSCLFVAVHFILKC